MKKITTSLCFIFLFLSALVAQDDMANISTKKGLKYHLNIGLNHVPKSLRFSTNLSEKFTYISPGIAYVWKKEKSYVEFGLADWYFKRHNKSNEHKEWLMQVSFRFEKGWRLGIPAKKLDFFLGYGFRHYVQFHQLEPSNSTAFPAKGFVAGLQVEFIPKMVYKISENWAIDLSVICLLEDFGIVFSRVKNPAWTDRQQRQDSFDFETYLGRKFIFRLGASKVF